MSTSLRFIASLAVLVAAAVVLPAAAGPASAQTTGTVAVGDIWFCDPSFQNGVCTTEVTEGDTVTWDFSDAVLPHTTTHCGDSCDSLTASPLWDSGITNDGAFSFTFAEPGTYPYYCTLHPFQRGEIVVRARAGEPDPTPAIPSDGGGDPPDGVPDGPGVVAGPVVGVGPDAAGSSVTALIVGAAAVGAALLIAGALLESQRRRWHH